MRHRGTPWVQGIRVSLLVGSFIVLVHGSANAATFCVSTAAELASALLTAERNGADDAIRVVQGTYQGTFVYSSDEAFSLTIEGGYVAGCTSRVVNPANTVLDARRTGIVLAVRSRSANFVVDGLTLQKGEVSSNASGLFVDMAGGDVTLTNNVIRDNIASFDAAGVSARGSTITLINNTISQNIASPYGRAGGASVQGTTITLINNTISQNTANEFYGGAFVQGTTITLSNNTISQNTSSNYGGASIKGTRITLTNNTISQNTARDSYGGASIEGTRITLTNNTITENGASSDGGGIRLSLRNDSDLADMYNNIIWGNSAGRGADLFLDNDGDGNAVPSLVRLFNNDFDQSTQGTFIQVPFVIDPSNLNNLNPLFVNPTNGDYHLQAGSPVIDRGNNNAPSLPPTDKDGNQRIFNGIVDMGAYEWPSSAPPPPDCDGDVNGDGRITPADALCVFQKFLGQPSCLD